MCVCPELPNVTNLNSLFIIHRGKDKQQFNLNLILGCKYDTYKCFTEKILCRLFLYVPFYDLVYVGNSEIDLITRVPNLC